MLRIKNPHFNGDKSQDNAVEIAIAGRSPEILAGRT